MVLGTLSSGPPFSILLTCSLTATLSRDSGLICTEKKYTDHVSKSTLSAPCLNQPTRERYGGEGLTLGVSWKRS